MREDNRCAAPLYRAGKFWNQINDEFVDLIWGGALTNVRNQYFNRRFAGPDPRSRAVYGALLWLYYQRVRELDSDQLLRRIIEPSEGGTFDQEIIDGRTVSLDFLQSIEEFYRIREAWQLAGRAGEPRLIVELGAGYGRLAYVFRKALPQCTYVILDLPEALMCSSSWLRRVLGKEVVPYSQSRRQTNLTRESLLSERLWTLGSQQIEHIADAAADAFINIFSFQEMPSKVIANYFVQIDRVIPGVFYTKQRNLEDNRVDNEQITVDSYPYPSSWRRLFQRPTLLYQHYFEAAYAVRAEG